jgi:hypothetical protein
VQRQLHQTHPEWVINSQDGCEPVHEHGEEAEHLRGESVVKKASFHFHATGYVGWRVSCSLA